MITDSNAVTSVSVLIATSTQLNANAKPNIVLIKNAVNMAEIMTNNTEVLIIFFAFESTLTKGVLCPSKIIKALK